MSWNRDMTFRGKMEGMLTPGRNQVLQHQTLFSNDVIPVMFLCRFCRLSVFSIRGAIHVVVSNLPTIMQVLFFVILNPLMLIAKSFKVFRKNRVVILKRTS